MIYYTANRMKWSSEADNKVSSFLRANGIEMKRCRRGTGLDLESVDFKPYFKVHAQRADQSSWGEDRLLPHTREDINGFTIECRTVADPNRPDRCIIDMVDGGIPCFFMKTSCNFARIACVSGEKIVAHYRAGHIKDFTTFIENYKKKEFFVVIPSDEMVCGYDDTIQYVRTYLENFKSVVKRPLNKNPKNSDPLRISLLALQKHFNDRRKNAAQ